MRKSSSATPVVSCQPAAAMRGTPVASRRTSGERMMLRVQSVLNQPRTRSGRAHGEAADDHAPHAGFEQRGDLILIADAAARLDAQAAFLGELLDQRARRMAGSSAPSRSTTCSQVGAGGLEAAGDRERVVAVGFLLVEFTFGESHDATTAQVDGGVDDHGRISLSSRDRRSRARRSS